jgi:hypothetical protein
MAFRCGDVGQAVVGKLAHCSVVLAADGPVAATWSMTSTIQVTTANTVDIRTCYL